MAKHENRRLVAKTLKQDKDDFANLQKIEGYAPNNKDHQAANIQKVLDKADTAQQTAAQAKAGKGSARNESVSAEWEFHNLMIAARGQVKTQFGADSNELASVGLKKASEYRSPKRTNGNGNGNGQPH